MDSMEILSKMFDEELRKNLDLRFAVSRFGLHGEIISAVISSATEYGFWVYAEHVQRQIGGTYSVDNIEALTRFGRTDLMLYHPDLQNFGFVEVETGEELSDKHIGDQIEQFKEVISTPLLANNTFVALIIGRKENERGRVVRAAKQKLKRLSSRSEIFFVDIIIEKMEDCFRICKFTSDRLSVI